MNEIIKSFRHITREILIYVIPDFLIVFYLFAYLYKFEKTYFDLLILSKYIIWLTLIMSYIFGHLSLAVQEFLCFLKNIKLCKGNTAEVESKDEYLKKEIDVFKNDFDSYEHFIERYNLLVAFRKNIVWINIVILVLNIVLWFCSSGHTPFFLTQSIINLLLILLFAISTCKTKKEFYKRINQLHDGISK